MRAFLETEATPTPARSSRAAEREGGSPRNFAFRAKSQAPVPA
jgi:hypothetical protein